MNLRRVAYLAGIVGVGLALAGCVHSYLGYQKRAAWHDAEERACVKARVIAVSAVMEPGKGFRQQNICGISAPLKISALEDGTVTVGPTATLNCPMTYVVDHWLSEAVQPAALAWLGVPVAEIKQISSYSCRPRNNQRGAKVSEHAYGNALDVAGFILADGREITVKADWNGDPNARGFLREVFAAACERFKTVLGPGVKFHSDHFHLDLAHHNADGTSRYCSPQPDGPAPERPPYGGLIAGGGGLLDRTITGSITPAAADGPISPLQAGPLLNEMPDDVIATLIDESEGGGDFAAMPIAPPN